VTRRALVATVTCLAALAAPAAAVAQDAALSPLHQPSPAPSPGPTLQVVSAQLRRAGADLAFGLRFNRTVPADEIDPAHGRLLCIVLSPTEPSRRRVCLSTRDGHLSATIAPIDLDGRVSGNARVLGRVRVRARGDVLRLRAPAASLRASLGGPVTWRVVLNWRDGGLCEAMPDPLACVQVTPPAGEQRLDPSAPPQPPAASPRRGHLRLLATGDSMIQVVDGYLQSSLAHRRATVVRSDAQISTGISKLGMLDWLRKAHGQAASFKPDVTVVFLGANDGFPMRTPSGASVGCCGAGWIAEYARRVAAMMRSYSRGGRSLVYWMTLPAPRGASFARVFDAVNPAIRRAAARVGDGVRVIELGPVFAPDGRFHQTITFHGRSIDARQPDGVHLSTAGAQVAASLVIDRLRADHALPRGR
jgi:lysophospholipase L1-like esterase